MDNDTIAYGLCSVCNEENLFRDGDTCARCLSLLSEPIESEPESDDSDSLLTAA